MARNSAYRQLAFVDAPVFNIALFAFLLNFVWDMLQIGFYKGMSEIQHWQGITICFLATLGDVGSVEAVDV